MTELAHRRPQAIATPQVDWDAALRYLNLSLKDPKAQALVMVCQRYDLDPLLGHVTLYDGKPYVHFAGYLHIANEHAAYLGSETVREWEDDTYYHATVRVHRSDREFPSERTGKSRKVKKKKDGSPYTDEDADAKAFAQACRRALRMAFNVAHPEPGEDEHDPTPAPAPVVEVARMATDPTLQPSVELVSSIETTEQAKNLVSGPAVGDRYREAVREAQMRLYGEVWADFWRAADRESWVAVLLEARRLLGEQMHESSRQPSDPGPAATPPGGPAGSDQTSEATAVPATSASHTRGAASDTTASAEDPGGNDATQAGRSTSSPSNAEASTSRRPPPSPGGRRGSKSRPEVPGGASAGTGSGETTASGEGPPAGMQPSTSERGDASDATSSVKQAGSVDPTEGNREGADPSLLPEPPGWD